MLAEVPDVVRRYRDSSFHHNVYWFIIQTTAVVFLAFCFVSLNFKICFKLLLNSFNFVFRQPIREDRLLSYSSL